MRRARRRARRLHALLTGLRRSTRPPAEYRHPETGMPVVYPDGRPVMHTRHQRRHS